MSKGRHRRSRDTCNMPKSFIDAQVIGSRCWISSHRHVPPSIPPRDHMLAWAVSSETFCHPPLRDAKPHGSQHFQRGRPRTACERTASSSRMDAAGKQSASHPRPGLLLAQDSPTRLLALSLTTGRVGRARKGTLLVPCWAHASAMFSGQDNAVEPLTSAASCLRPLSRP